MSILIKLRNILIIFKIFYWFALKGSIKGLIRNRDIRLSHRYWAEYCCNYFKVNLIKLEESKEMRREKTLLLTNHRTQSDFFVHEVITEHQNNFLSRLLVGVVFFIFSISGRYTVWFFNRSGNIDPEKFNKWLDYKFQKSPRPSLLAYPEGHRMGAITAVDPSKLKTGMIRYGYRRAIPVQLLMTFGNQNVFNEKKLSMEWNQKVYYSFSKVYLPSDYQTENEFVAAMKTQFTNYFAEIYQKYLEKKEVDQQERKRK